MFYIYVCVCIYIYIFKISKQQYTFDHIGWIWVFQMILLPPLQSPGSQRPFRFVQEGGLHRWSHSTVAIVPGLSSRWAAPFSVCLGYRLDLTCSRAQEASKAETACAPDDLVGESRLSSAPAGSLGGGILTQLSERSPVADEVSDGSGNGFGNLGFFWKVWGPGCWGWAVAKGAVVPAFCTPRSRSPLEIRGLAERCETEVPSASQALWALYFFPRLWDGI